MKQGKVEELKGAEAKVFSEKNQKVQCVKSQKKVKTCEGRGFRKQVWKFGYYTLLWLHNNPCDRKNNCGVSQRNYLYTLEI